MVLLAHAVAVAAAAATMARAADAAEPDRFRAERVVSFGDVHGAYGPLVTLLGELGLIDADLSWQGGATHLVSLGDLMDRGPDSRAVLDLLRRLATEAEAAGGRVHVLLGNHELMSLTGDLRYVSAGERAAFADLAPPAADPETDGLAGVRAAYAADGPYGSWLLDRPAAVVINDTAYVHGGLTEQVADLGPGGLNAAVSRHLTGMLELQRQLEQAQVLPPALEVHDAAELLEGALGALPEAQQALAERFMKRVGDPLFGDAGPFWYRGNARCPALLEQPGLSRVFEAWNISRVVVGHTPTEDHRVRVRLDGAVVLTDTGMLSTHYHGVASALIIESDEMRVYYAGNIAGDIAGSNAGTNAGTNAEASGTSAPVVLDGTPLQPLEETALLSVLPDLAAAVSAPGTWQPLEVAGAGELAVRLEARARRARDAELAALRLDRLLGLNLVLPMAANGAGDGVVVAAWRGVVDEATRTAQAAGGPDWCAGGNVYELVYAFDALIGNQGRSQQTLVYDPRTWRLGSIGHGDSFGRDRRFPAYLERQAGRLPVALAERLRTLDEAELERALGDLVGSAQRRAILARRDRLLERWTVGN